jgi:hypothetical protein
MNGLRTAAVGEAMQEERVDTADRGVGLGGVSDNSCDIPNRLEIFSGGVIHS